MRKIIALSLLWLSTLAYAQDRLSDNEARFYKNNIPKQQQTVALSGKDSPADSETLNKAIASLSKAGGGTLFINRGVYYLNDIVMRSNIHLKISSQATIQLPSPTPIKAKNKKKNKQGKNDPKGKSAQRVKASGKIFDLGSNIYAENVAITSVKVDSENDKNWFTVILPSSYGTAKLVQIGHVKNFKISGVKIEDNFSRHSAISLGLAKDRQRAHIPLQGVIKNIFIQNSNVGYGVVQMQAGKSVLYKNLEGIGGVTLRVETGAKETNTVNVLTVDDVVGRNIRVINGDAAANLSPHRVDQGRVDIENITAVNSTHAVQIAAGFKDKTGTVDNLGTFDKRSFIGGITVTGGEGAQVKSKDLIHYDCEVRKKIEMSCINPDFSSRSGSSIGVIRNNASTASGCKSNKNGCYDINIGKITKTNNNFIYDNNFVYQSMAKKCPAEYKEIKKNEEACAY